MPNNCLLYGKRVPIKDIEKRRLSQTGGSRGLNVSWRMNLWKSWRNAFLLLTPHWSLTILFSVSTTGVTVHSASLSSSSSISVSLEFTSYKLLASLAGEHGEYLVLLLILYVYEHLLTLTHNVIVSFCQWMDRSFNWSEHQYPSGHHHVTDCSPVHCTVCGLAHYV